MAATTMPLWATAQAAIVSALKEVSIRDAAVSPALAFSASKNLYLPHILSLTQKAIVNVRIIQLQHHHRQPFMVISKTMLLSFVIVIV